MKIIISADGIKREVEGPFAFCLDRKTADLIIHCLNKSFRDRNVSYGWVDIVETTPTVGGSPLPWNEQSDYQPLSGGDDPLP